MTVRERVLSSRVLEWTGCHSKTAGTLGICGELIKRKPLAGNAVSEQEDNKEKPVNVLLTKEAYDEEKR